MGLVVIAPEIGATLIGLSCTLGQTAVFGKTALRALAANLQTETGVEVRIPEQE
jgi:hypothetical protein